ncbi:MAG: hypothetical protein J6M53_03940 [Bacteroidaceae bacterium]|nr:hypothetical protein [Bacteroidaceae bacterium]
MKKNTLFPRLLLLCGVVAMSLTLASCGGDDDKDEPDTPAKPDAAFAFNFENTYYMWDAKQWYWYGVDNYPTENGVKMDNYPTSATSDPDRWCNTAELSRRIDSYSAASYSAKYMPCYNALTWYLSGDVYWDDTTVWTLGGKQYTGGVWLKKLSKIPGAGNSTSCAKAYDWNTDEPYKSEKDMLKGKPTDTSDYFFLPALGRYSTSGELVGVGEFGCFWSSSTGDYHYWETADEFYFSEKSIGIDNSILRYNCCVAGSRPDHTSWFQ